MSELKKEDWIKQKEEFLRLVKVAELNLAVFENGVELCKKKIKDFG